jgi:hypothetical protein
MREDFCTRGARSLGRMIGAGVVHDPDAWKPPFPEAKHDGHDALFFVAGRDDD